MKESDGWQIDHRPALRNVLASLLLFALAASAFSLHSDRIAAQSTVQVVAITTTLDPAQLTIAVGTTVRWDNHDSSRHRIRSTSGPAEFDGDLEPGASFTFVFDRAGTYQYRDDRARDLSNYWGTMTVTSDATPGGGTTPTPGGGATPVPATSAAVGMAGRAFAPSTITIAQGATVTWRNDDSREHTVTGRGNSFDSGIMAAGASFEKVFTTPGSYPYFCAIHPDMTGTVNVTAPDGQVPTPTPTPVTTPRPPTSGDIEVLDFDFSPAEHRVAVGARVTWVNNGVALHTVTSRDGSFDSGMMPAGATFSRAFATAGTYQYLCSLHANMTGSVVVGAQAGAPPPPVVTPTPRPSNAGAGDVRIVDFEFNPGQLTVMAGATVTWVNDGVAPHTVTARDRSFDSGTIRTGAPYSRRFDAPGTFPYICGLHPDMTGILVVTDAQGVAPPPAAPPPSAAPARPPGATPPGVADVDIVDSGFSPAQISIPAGGTVRWVNSGVAPHTVTARDGAYDSGYLSHNDQFTRIYPTAGTFAYFCAIHPGMAGSVVVGAGTGGAAGGTPATSGTEAAAGRSSPVPGVDVPANDVDAEMRDFVYEPIRILVRPGGTVTWTNTGAAPHTVDARDGSFSSGLKQKGESFSYRFDQAGVFEYFCAVHPNMIGTVEVTDRIATSPAVDGATETGGIPPVALVLVALIAIPLGALGTYVVMRRSGSARGLA